MSKNFTIQVQSIDVSVTKHAGDDYICLTDMAKARTDAARAADVIKNWIRTRTTLEFLGTWEKIYNPDFKVVEFDHFKSEAGLPSFVLSPSQWVEKTSAIGIFAKAGRYGGTYAHKDIAFEFGSAISPEFKLYLLKEFQRLKAEENDRLKLGWSLQRTLAKVNYVIHTDAIKERLIPAILSPKQTSSVYASEADLLNMALFGMTAKDWRDANPELEGNMRDHATLEQLVVLSNLESLNSVFIRQGIPASDRLRQLNEIAVSQMTTLLNHKRMQSLADSNSS
ncbi:MAG TPA: KilA-N domain-containing protein [Opitutales bacterium]|nr:KilA-N domain-containing protein [Opitutales bacterium]